MEPSTSNIKIKALKDISIPYILNGELYSIITQDGENVTVKCCSCPSDRVYRGSVRSTGNFHMHIKRRHPELLGKLHEMKVGSLLVRRERLLKAKKLALRGRIKREESATGEEMDTSTKQVQSQNMSYAIDYSCSSSQDEAAESADVNRLPTATEREPNIVINTEVHCDRNANMGVVAPPMYFVAVKEEAPVSTDDQAMDLSTSSSKRTDNSLTLQVSNLRWEQVLQRVENSLKDIQHEMRTRNQIETNRIFLDLAKFKYLNPGFHYQS